MKWQTYELYLRNLMAQQLEIPILGQLHFACPQGSSTSRFEEYARTELDIPAELLHMGSGGIKEAFDACSAARNDCVLVFPGAYDVDEEIAWSKDWTHMIGMGGPNSGGDWSLPGVNIYTDNVATVETVDITGDRCQFLNLNISNYGNNAACLGALNVDGWGCHFKKVTIVGTMHAAQANVEAAGSLFIDRLGHFPIFEDCIIGHNNWAGRTLSGHAGALRFVGTAEPRPQNGLFRRCQFLTKSTDNECHAIVAPAGHALYGLWQFDDCSFHNYQENNAAELSFVFWDANMDTHSFLLNRCSQLGFDQWQHGDLGNSWFGVTMPTASTSGGNAVNPTAS